MIKRGHQKQTGFTIVELLIVIVVIAILATIIIVTFNGIQNRAKVSSLKSDLNNAAKQLEIAKITSDGVYPMPETEPANLQKSADTKFFYDSDGTGYCLTAVSMSGNVGAFHISATQTAIQSGIQDGPCEVHQGLVPGDSGNPIAACPTGFIKVPGNSKFGTSDFCVMKYEAKNDGSNQKAVSQATGTPWVSITRPKAINVSQASCSGCHLITEEEWLTIAHNVLSVSSNWSGGSMGSGYIYSGHNDSSPNGVLAASTNDADGYTGTGNSGGNGGNQRRTLKLSNGETIWDFAGNAAEWTQSQTTSSLAQFFSWRDWESSHFKGKNWTPGPNPIPDYGTPAAANWDDYWGTYGLGHVYGCSGTTCNYVNGGYYADDYRAGIFSVTFDYSSNTVISDGLGFRVVK